jgi:hypothetical protein
MGKRRASRCLPLTGEGAENMGEHFMEEGEITIIPYRKVNVVREVARRRRRLGVDLWKEVTRREHRARKISE